MRNVKNKGDNNEKNEKEYLFLLLMLPVIFVSFSLSLLADNNDDWLHARGNKIYDKYGNEVWLTGANWFGFNCSENVFHGAWYDIKTILTDIADRGIGLLQDSHLHRVTIQLDDR